MSVPGSPFLCASVRGRDSGASPDGCWHPRCDPARAPAIDSSKSWKTWHFPFHAVPDLPETLLEGRERPYLDWFFREKTAHPGAFDEAALSEYLRIFTAPGAIRAGLAFYRAAGTSAAQNKRLAQARRLSLPVLGLGADQGSIPDLAGALAPFCANIHSGVIAGCGHFQPEEQPRAVATALMAFFAKVPEAMAGSDIS